MSDYRLFCVNCGREIDRCNVLGACRNGGYLHVDGGHLCPDGRLASPGGNAPIIYELVKLARAMGIEEQPPDEDTDYNKGMRDAALMLRHRVEELATHGGLRDE